MLDKLRYMRGTSRCRATTRSARSRSPRRSPAPTHKTVKAVRDYERKFGDRRAVLMKPARVLPTATASAEEDQRP